MRAARFVPLVLLVACSGITVPYGWRRDAGIIDPAMSSAQLLQLPAEIYAGVPFTAVVTTLGPDSCTRLGGTDLDVDATRAELRPWDLTMEEPMACRDAVQVLEHRVRLTLRRAGNATVVVRGRSWSGAALEYEANVTVLDPGTTFAR